MVTTERIHVLIRITYNAYVNKIVTVFQPHLYRVTVVSITQKGYIDNISRQTKKMTI